MNDLISRQDAINAIVKRLDIKDESFLTEQEKTIVKVLRGMPSAQQWIPCSERLPEKDWNYLTFAKWSNDEGFYIQIIPFDTCAGEFGICHEIFDPITLGSIGVAFDAAKVIAWMPLPEPWKGEEDVCKN